MSFQATRLLSLDQWVLNNTLYFQTPAVTKFMVIFTWISANAAITLGSLVVVTYSFA